MCKNTDETEDQTFNQVNWVHPSKTRTVVFISHYKKDLLQPKPGILRVITFHLHTSFLSVSHKDLTVTFTFMS